MPDEDKTFSGSLVLDLRIWWRHVHTLYILILFTTPPLPHPPTKMEIYKFVYLHLIICFA